MAIEIINSVKGHGSKKKSPSQLQLLEKYYSDEKYPTPTTMEEFAAILNLTYRQTRTWFIERRRKERRESEIHGSSKSLLISKNKSGGGKILMKNPALNQTESKFTSKSKYTRATDQESDQSANSILYAGSGSYRQNNKQPTSKKNCKRGSLNEIEMRFNNSSICQELSNRKLTMLHKKYFALSKINRGVKKTPQSQSLVSKDYILKRVFRKDGPPLGVEFDSLPSTSFGFQRDSGVLHSSQDRLRASKSKKILCPPKAVPRNFRVQNITSEKHGIGKGLMTVWRATNPDNVSCPSDIVLADGFRSSFKEIPCKPPKRAPQRKLVPKQRNIQKKVQEKRKPVVKKRKVQCNKDANQKKFHWQTCKLVNDESDTEQSNALVQLVDDEELELREIQLGPNPLRCSAHFASDGKHSCPLCKDLLAKFPPQTVKMKQLFCTKPWDTSPELVKKLFKVLKFLYNDAATIKICPFTIDELANAFTDKDSVLLGNIHVSLLKFLLFNVEKEIAGLIPRATKDGKFLGLLHFVREQEIDVNTWSQSLNPLTWTEILRQVLVAAGFGSKSILARKDDFNKERNLMARYGLRPRTLKGELFTMLSECGSGGLKVSELAKASQIVALDLPDMKEELEKLICTTLSRDITLFEKISPAAYRLRINPDIKGKEDHQSDSEVDDDFGSCSGSSNTFESDGPEELNSVKSDHMIVKCRHQYKRKGQKLIEYTEIDESYSGEAWLLGLMEGEYSDLSIDEKLDALMALIDLTGSCSNLRIEESERVTRATIPNKRYHGSGAKITKSLMDHILASQDAEIGSELSNKEQNSATTNTAAKDTSKPDAHAMQSIFLGSDRRYNNYWLFIGPCDIIDPGHRQVYFESSEDGHWEVISTTQALDALLSALDCRGAREARLLTSLEKRGAFLCQAMDKYTSTEFTSTQSELNNISGDGSSPISDVDNNPDSAESLDVHLASASAKAHEIGKNKKEKKKSWERMQEFDKWVWNAFYSNLHAVKSSKIKSSYVESLTRCESCHDLYCRDEKHCRTCHTTFQLDFDIEETYAIHVATCTVTEDNRDIPKHKVLPSQLQALKAASHAIEAVMPPMALSTVWTGSAHKLWVKRLQRTSSLPEFLQVLVDFVGAIKEDWLYECASTSGGNAVIDDIIVNFQTMPQTTSAIALWMVKLDALIAPHLKMAQPIQEAENEPCPKRRRICTS